MPIFTDQALKYSNDLSEEENKKRAAQIKCSICGEPFSLEDLFMGNNQIDLWANYPSSHDLERIQFNFCVNCFDSVLDMIIARCKDNPIKDTEYMVHCYDNNDCTIHRDRGPGAIKHD